MLPTEYNKSAVRDNTVIKLGRATGITNFSNSSKLKNISDIVSNDVFLFTDELHTAINNIHEETATGNFLELLASKHGVYKNRTTHYDILASDQILKIKPKNPDETLSDLFSVSRYIYRGEKFNIGSGITMMILNNIEINSSSTDVYISARLSSDGTSNIQFNTEDVIKLVNTIDLKDVEAQLIVEVQKDIALITSSEKEADFRSRVIRAKLSRKNVAIKSAIDNVLFEIPGNLEYAIYNNEGGSGNIDIYFITQKQKANSVDASSSTISRLISSRLRSVIADGIQYSVNPATPIETHIKFQYVADIEIDIDTFKNAIYTAFFMFYKFNESNVLLIENIETFVQQKIPALTSINIVDVSLFDTSINEFISYGNQRAIAPKGTHMTISKDNIEIF